mmetsp:Transcript_13668/g.28751  ORF Transcript_13668/g.28751 Transcript_13668/m.28751 type:complete len:250 (+) Transcript_13668:283-1032(+)
MQTTLPNTQNLNYQANSENATGVQWIENNQTEFQIAIPWAPGVGHGPLWSVDPTTGQPSRDCDGNMMYPFHRNLINDNAQDNEPLRFTMWCAYEHPQEHVTVPLSMLTEWPNAHLQTTMDPGQCGEAAEGTTADGQAEVTGDEVQLKIALIPQIAPQIIPKDQEQLVKLPPTKAPTLLIENKYSCGKNDTGEGVQRTLKSFREGEEHATRVSGTAHGDPTYANMIRKSGDNGGNSSGQKRVRRASFRSD